MPQFSEFQPGPQEIERSVSQVSFVEKLNVVPAPGCVPIYIRIRWNPLNCFSYGIETVSPGFSPRTGRVIGCKLRKPRPSVVDIPGALYELDEMELKTWIAEQKLRNRLRVMRFPLG